ncbi:MAG TPA: YicC/YloC family endoribonuclease [Polyangium sp.]|uniref:YicC family protein n=4 Tax=Polyangium TaxID=55 RepID=A0A4U1JEV2_9BACT|nr:MULTISPECIES: YicC/YloC family endoribonuclease [Polyangium]MDC0745216.1 YicC family protein [Polyangium mundeleinium]MDI1436645.1 YicC family protein [Polyangium sorediatum]TKD08673.1 YicC family protein [Polyangium fumosum]HVK66088.1 YicC/YloC family endoribonuclease [Polyangium sp.]
MRSMTGFGIGEVTLGEGRVLAEIRSVNQRFLDVRTRLPRELAEIALFAEQVVRERLRRGRVELVVRTEGPVLTAATLDVARARAAFRQLLALRDELAPGAELPLALLSAVPDLFIPPAGPELAAVRDAVRRAIEAAISAMDAMCRAEGEALLADLSGRCQALRRLIEAIASQADGLREAAQRRLHERLERLLASAELTVDRGRLELELAILVDKSDFTEELTRLRSHLDQLEGVLAASGGEPVGRRLDFLLQEMVREANTLGAKAQDASVSQIVVGIKVELERLREQVQNVE